MVTAYHCIQNKVLPQVVLNKNLWCDMVPLDFTELILHFSTTANESKSSQKQMKFVDS